MRAFTENQFADRLTAGLAAGQQWGKKKAGRGTTRTGLHQRTDRHFSAPRAKLPAYGRELAEAVNAGAVQAGKHGWHVEVTLHPANAIWFHSDRIPHRLAVFEDTDPASLNWSLVSGLSLLLRVNSSQSSRERIASFAQAVAAASPAAIHLHDDNPLSPAFRVLTVRRKGGQS